ncbi:MAG: ornithine cyclodeaminase family protein [Parvularculaceae bacterium]
MAVPGGNYREMLAGALSILSLFEKALRKMTETATLDLTAIDGRLLEASLPPRTCVELMRKAMIEVSAGGASLPDRRAFDAPGGAGKFGVMPGGSVGLSRYGVKIVSFFPARGECGHSTHSGLYLLFDAQTGRPLAAMDAGRLTAIRTAAVTALATQTLAARTETIAILGAGEQAERHIRTLRATLRVDRFRLWGRRRASAERLAKALARTGIDVEVVDSVKSATSGADVICTCTSAIDPVLTNDDVDDGVHVNLIGASFPDRAEADARLVARGRLVVDFRPAALAQAGEVKRAIEAGLIGPSHIACELGAVLAGDCPGRESDDQVTIYKSLGVAAQDVAAASHAYDSIQGASASSLLQL